MSVLVLFLLALSAGILSTSFWVPGDDVGRGYFQTNALVVLGLLSVASVVVWLHPIQPFGRRAAIGTILLALALLAGFAYYGAIWRERWRLAQVPAALALAATAAALLLGGASLIPARTPLPYREAWVVLSLLGGAALLGWSLVTMLLGHWYLIVPKLSFRHLTVFCRVLLAVVMVRALSLLLTLGAAYRVDPFVLPHPWRMMIDLGGQGMFFWFRVLWGLVIPALLAWMALHCARNRSNQSATGILYVLLVGTFIGEITALYLAVTTGIPV